MSIKLMGVKSRVNNKQFIKFTISMFFKRLKNILVLTLILHQYVIQSIYHQNDNGNVFNLF